MEITPLETEDLVLDVVDPSDCDALVAVRASNPDRLARTEGSGEGAGHYDRAMLERDLMVAAFDPARLFLAVRRRDDGRVVGYVDVLDAHPDDGGPWLGAVEIAAAEQRQGYGRQCVEAVIDRARDVLGAKAIRAAIDDEDGLARGFLERLGFQPVSQGTRTSPLGRVTVTVLERQLIG